MNIFKLNKHIKSASWLLYEKIFKVLSGILVSVTVAKYLGPEKYGLISVVFGTVSIFVAGATMGSDHINVYEFSKRKYRSAIFYLNSTLVARFSWALFLYLMAILFLIVVLKNKNYQIYLIASTTILLTTFSVIGNKIQSCGKFSAYAKISIISLFISGMLRVAGVFFQKNIIYFSVINVVEIFLVGIFAYYFYVKNILTYKKIKYSKEISFKYFKLCIPTALAAILVAVYFRVELFVVNYLMGNFATGLWAVVTMFITPWAMIAGSIVPVANRYLTSLHMENEGYILKLENLIRIMLLIAFSAILINCTVAYLLIPYLFGEEYLDIQTVICIASFSIVPLFMGSVQEIWIAHKGLTSIVLKKVVLGLPVSCSFFYLFGANLGLNGIALALVASYFFTAILMNYFLDRDFYKIQLSAIGVYFEK